MFANGYGASYFASSCLPQIGWDAPLVPYHFPGDFFDKTVTRGAVFKARFGRFVVSNSATQPPVDNHFSSILPKAQTRRFIPFSPQRLFTPINNNKFTVHFKVPATNYAAAVSGLGAVFVDVDVPKRTYMKYYDRDGCLIAKVQVQPRSKGLSFAGITVHRTERPGKLMPVISKVVVRLGNISVEQFARKWKGHYFSDLVVADDVIYGEPQQL